MPTHEGWRNRWADGSADHATSFLRSPGPGQPYELIPMLSREAAREAAAASDWPADIPIHRLELQAGDCAVFSERLTHSTVPWVGKGDRKTVFMKYVQHEMKWSSSAGDAQLYDLEHPDFTPEQRHVLETPKVFANEGMERAAGQPPTVGPESPWTWKERGAAL